MYRNNIDTKLIKRIQSKEFEESVDQAVRAFMYDLDYMLLEEHQNSSNQNYSCIQSNGTIKWINRLKKYINLLKRQLYHLFIFSSTKEK